MEEGGKKVRLTVVPSGHPLLKSHTVDQAGRIILHQQPVVEQQQQNVVKQNVMLGIQQNNSVRLAGVQQVNNSSRVLSVQHVAPNSVVGLSQQQIRPAQRFLSIQQPAAATGGGAKYVSIQPQQHRVQLAQAAPRLQQQQQQKAAGASRVITIPTSLLNSGALNIIANRAGKPGGITTIAGTTVTNLSGAAVHAKPVEGGGVGLKGGNIVLSNLNLGKGGVGQSNIVLSGDTSQANNIVLSGPKVSEGGQQQQVLNNLILTKQQGQNSRYILASNPVSGGQALVLAPGQQQQQQTVLKVGTPAATTNSMLGVRLLGQPQAAPGIVSTSVAGQKQHTIVLGGKQAGGLANRSSQIRLVTQGSPAGPIKLSIGASSQVQSAPVVVNSNLVRPSSVPGQISLLANAKVVKTKVVEPRTVVSSRAVVRPHQVVAEPKQLVRRTAPLPVRLPLAAKVSPAAQGGRPSVAKVHCQQPAVSRGGGVTLLPQQPVVTSVSAQIVRQQEPAAGQQQGEEVQPMPDLKDHVALELAKSTAETSVSGMTDPQGLMLQDNNQSAADSLLQDIKTSEFEGLQQVMGGTLDSQLVDDILGGGEEFFDQIKLTLGDSALQDLSSPEKKLDSSRDYSPSLSLLPGDLTLSPLSSGGSTALTNSQSVMFGSTPVQAPPLQSSSSLPSGGSSSSSLVVPDLSAAASPSFLSGLQPIISRQELVTRVNPPVRSVSLTPEVLRMTSPQAPATKPSTLSTRSPGSHMANSSVGQGKGQPAGGSKGGSGRSKTPAALKREANRLKARQAQKLEASLKVQPLVDLIEQSYNDGNAYGELEEDDVELLNIVEREARGDDVTYDLIVACKKYFEAKKPLRRYIDAKMAISDSEDSDCSDELTDAEVAHQLKVHVRAKRRKAQQHQQQAKADDPSGRAASDSKGSSQKSKGRRAGKAAAADRGGDGGGGNSIQQLNMRRHRLWLAIMKKEVLKAGKARNYNTKEKAASAKRVATACMRAQRQRAMASQKVMKEAVWRAKRLTREMQAHWRKFDREEKQQKRAKEKIALEQRKLDIEILEAKRQQRKLNFLITQTELYAHFMAKKMGHNTSDNESAILSRLNSDVSDERLRALDNYDERGTKQKAMQGAKGAAQRQDAARVSFDRQTVGEAGLRMSEAAETAGDRPQPTIFRGQLKTYQLKGMNWLCSLYDQGINGILADEMGLGKTVQALAFLAHVAETYGVWGPFLVITPASTLHNWQQEVNRFLPDFKTVPYWGSPQERKVLRGFWTQTNLHTKEASFHIVVTSYQIVITDYKYFNRHAWQYMVLDEAQAIKSASSQRWKMLLEFRCRSRLLLSGTPIQNTMAELWSLLHFVMPALFDSHEEFNEWFSKDIEGHVEGSRAKVDEKQMSRLHLILKPFMLRRIKKDVEHELTDKVEVLVYCPLTIRQKLLYTALKQNIRTEELLAGLGLTGQTASSTPPVSSLMNLVMQFRKVCNHPELFERREPRSPQLVSVARPQLPALLLDKPPGHAHHPRHSVHRADRVHRDLKQTRTVVGREYLEVSDSAFSFLRFCHLSVQEYEGVSTDLYQRWLLAAAVRRSLPPDKPGGGGGVSLLLPGRPAPLQFTSRTGTFLSHRDVLMHSVQETVSHRLIRSRHLQQQPDDDDGTVVMVPEHVHVPREPRVDTCVPCSCPSFLHYLTPRVSAVPQAPYLSSVRARNRAQDHDNVWAGPGRWGKACLTEGLPELAAACHYTPRRAGGLAASTPQHGWSGIVIPDKQSLISDAGKLFVLDRLLARLKEGGHRVLIYSQMTRMIDLLEEYMSHRQHSYMRLDGSSKIHERRDMVADFQQRQDIFVFLLSTRAGGLGINLTAADTVIFYDSDWNPTVDQQAMDRAHRLGQTRQVTVYRLICKGTIEERILQRAREKSEIQRMVIQGGSFKGRGDLKPTEVVSLLLEDDELVKAKFEDRQLKSTKKSKEQQGGGGDGGKEANRKVKDEPEVKKEAEMAEEQQDSRQTDLAPQDEASRAVKEEPEEPKPLFLAGGKAKGGRGGGKRGRPRGAKRSLGRGEAAETSPSGPDAKKSRSRPKQTAGKSPEKLVENNCEELPDNVFGFYNQT